MSYIDMFADKSQNLLKFPRCNAIKTTTWKIATTKVVIAIFICCLSAFFTTVNATTHNVGTWEELILAVEAADPGDVINITNNISNEEVPLGGLSNEEVPLGKAITIEGNGHTIDGNGKSRIFKIFIDTNLPTPPSEILVTINNLNLTGGYTDGDDETDGGGAVWIGSNCTLKATGCKFYNNIAVVEEVIDGNGGFGGAVYINNGKFEAIDCEFYGNTSLHGGAVYGIEGVVFEATGCKFYENTANISDDGDGGEGGAVCIADGTFIAMDCEFYNNTANGSDGNGGNGGAVCFYNATQFTATNCVFRNNTSLHGGAVLIFYGIFEAINCIFFGNTGAAIYTPEFSSVDIFIFHSSIIANKSHSVTNHPASGIYMEDGTLYSYNSLYIGNKNSSGNILATMQVNATSIGSGTPLTRNNLVDNTGSQGVQITPKAVFGKDDFSHDDVPLVIAKGAPVLSETDILGATATSPYDIIEAIQTDKLGNDRIASSEGCPVTYGAIEQPNLALFNLTLEDDKNGRIVVGEDGVPLGSVRNITCGNMIDITAVPNSCYEFYAWLGEDGVPLGSLIGNPVRIPITSNITLKASFIPVSDRYSLTTAVNEPLGGSIEITPPEPTAPPGYTCGTSVTVKAIINPDYTFRGWFDDSGNFISAANPYTFNITEDTHLQGRFDPVREETRIQEINIKKGTLELAPSK